eukprot:scaffold329_cov118-Skeletonema_menzelii.AAC.8
MMLWLDGPTIVVRRCVAYGKDLDLDRSQNPFSEPKQTLILLGGLWNRILTLPPTKTSTRSEREIVHRKIELGCATSKTMDMKNLLKQH